VARQKAIRDIRAQTADLDVEAAEKVIHQRIDNGEAQRALEESIDELEQVSRQKD